MIEVIQSDITALDVDAIVNAANSTLGGGGGVFGFPKSLAAEIALDVMSAHESEFDRVVACVFDNENFSLYTGAVR